MSVYPEGVDLSNNQGPVNLAAVQASGRSFVFLKATEGVAFRDSFFAGWWRDAKALGLYRGSYHFGKPSQNSPEDEAAFFVAIVSEQGIEPGDMLALDLEDPDASGPLNDWALRFLERAEALAGFAPLIYTSPGYIVDHLLNRSPELGRFPLWCASWGVSTPPQAPPPWDLVSFHQYAVGGSGSVPGVSGECDLNRFNGLLERIPFLGKPGTIAPPVMPDPGPDVAALQARISELEAERSGHIETVADIADRMGDLLYGYAEAIKATVEQMRTERQSAIGPRP